MNLSLSDAGRIQGKGSMAFFPQLRKDGEKTNKNGKGNTQHHTWAQTHHRARKTPVVIQPSSIKCFRNADYFWKSCIFMRIHQM